MWKKVLQHLNPQIIQLLKVRNQILLIVTLVGKMYLGFYQMMVF